ncbi:MAG: hypothetical protein LRY63_02650 [Nitrincola sp.]|nr:hypothetical protein [Nitrincola sp.]
MFLNLHLDQHDFWLGIIVCCASMLAAVWFMFRHLRRYRLITDTPTAMIRSAPQGYVEIIGNVIGGEAGLLTAPLSGKPCVWYRYRVDKESGGRKNRWRAEHQGTSVEWFKIDDGTGICWIDPTKAEIDAVQHRVWYGNTPHPNQPAKKTHFLNTPIFNSRYRYIETLILEHERVYALGTFQTLGGGRGVASIEQLQAKIIRDWKADYDDLLIRFGSPGEALLNDTQWANVREAAKQAAIKERQVAFTAPDKHVLSNPNLPGHPLLISTQDEEKLVSRFRLRAGLCLAYILAALWFCSELLSATVY